MSSGLMQAIEAVEKMKADNEIAEQDAVQEKKWLAANHWAARKAEDEEVLDVLRGLLSAQKEQA